MKFMFQAWLLRSMRRGQTATRWSGGESLFVRSEELAAHGGYGAGLIKLDDDGSGIPVLTDEAREAMRKEQV